MIHLIALLLALTLTPAASPQPVGPVDWSSRTEGDVEIIQGQAGDLFMESRIHGEKMTSTMHSGTQLQVVEVDQGSPFFTITVNGQSFTYDRRDFEVERADSKTNATHFGKLPTTYL